MKRGDFLEGCKCSEPFDEDWRSGATGADRPLLEHGRFLRGEGLRARDSVNQPLAAFNGDHLATIRAPTG